MSGTPDQHGPGGTPPSAADQPGDTASDAPAPPVAQETDGARDPADFAARLDVDPDRDDVKG